MDILQAALLIGLAFILFLLVMLVIYYFVYTSSHPTPKPTPQPQQQFYQPPAQLPPVQYGYNASRIVLSSESDPAGSILKASMSCLVLSFTAAVLLSCLVAIIGIVIASIFGVGVIEFIALIIQELEKVAP